MGFPPVVAGLLIYIILSSKGPLGWLQLLYTPSAMIIAQTLLITPIIISLTNQTIEDLYQEYQEQLKIMHFKQLDCVKILLWDSRYSLITVVLSGFGRALAEVGAVIIVGGNINHLTRVMTTTIQLETSKGDLTYALALGMMLMISALCINIMLNIVKIIGKKYSYM